MSTKNFTTYIANLNHDALTACKCSLVEALIAQALKAPNDAWAVALLAELLREDS